MKQTWTLFGAGNFIYDIIDAIQENGDFVRQLVLNQSIKVEIPEIIQKVNVRDFEPVTDHYFFGFFDKAKEKWKLSMPWDLTFSTLIHPRAYFSNFSFLEEGGYIGPNATIAPKVNIGSFSYINRCASIGHNTVLGGYNIVGPSATICGECKIGSKCYIGAGAIIRDGITIPDNTVIGMGAVVTKNILESGKYLGIPAKRAGRR